ncbi:hypothetical protein D3C72_1594220 [compost metagenome]
MRLAHRAGHALEVLDGPQADVQVELLAQRHVQRADAAADGRGQRALDRHRVFLQRIEGFLRQPLVRAVQAGGFFAGVHFHPVDFLVAAVGLGHRGIDDLDHHRGDVDADAVAFDERDDRVVRNWLARDDFLSVGRYPDMGCAHHYLSFVDSICVVLCRGNPHCRP